MDTFEKTISNFVEHQFPEIYREHGDVFILFVKKYYEWMESTGNVLYRTRRLAEYRDIDETTDEFIVFFKEQYLKNIDIDTTTDIRLLLKHSLDLYRSKGTERSVNLLFRIVFGTGAKFYYPGDDLFKLSDGRWYQPLYLETTTINNPDNYAGKEIIGVTSKAKAFVEKVVRRNVKGKISDIMYVSSVKNDFKAGEKIRIFNSNNYVLSQCPTLLGSLSEVELSKFGSGSGFVIGDIVDVSSNSGYSAKARVTSVSEQNGLITFDLIDGGYGFTANSNVYISEVSLSINALSTFEFRDTVSQTIANISFNDANGTFTIGTPVMTRYANGSQKGTGIVVYTNYTNSTSGFVKVGVISGNLNAANVYSVYASPEIVIVKSSFGYVNAVGSVVGTSQDETTTKIGLDEITNEFYISTPISTGEYVITKSSGTNASFEIANDLLFTENVRINSDLISTFANTSLIANDYLIVSGGPAENLSTVIANSLNYTNTTIGSISLLINMNPGEEYNDIPFVVIHEPLVTPYSRHNYLISYSNTATQFTVGEEITQTSSNGRGIVKSTNSTHLIVRNMRFYSNNDFVVTTNSSSRLVGESSGASANCIEVSFDLDSEIEGLNANVIIDLTSSNGSISSAEVVDSGFGFRNGEDLVLTKGDLTAYASAVVTKQGKGSGYYKTIGGVLSSQKKLHDGYYWQDFSYDIISSVMINRYKELLKSVVHTAGFKFFGTVNHQQTANSYLAKSKTIISVE